MSIKDKVENIGRLSLAYLPTPVYRLNRLSEETGRILDEDFNTDGLRFIDGYKGRGYALSSDYSLNRTR